MRQHLIITTNMPQLAANQIFLDRNSHLVLVVQGGYFFFAIATTMATMVAIKLLVELAKGNFSSRGLAFGTWMIKPDVSAPGVNITSTIPTHNPANPHGYGSKQGTSMASLT